MMRPKRLGPWLCAALVVAGSYRWYRPRDIDHAAAGAPGGFLSDDGLIVLEHASRTAPPQGPTRTVKAGDSSLSFYQKQRG